jgi:hypothetical protein
MTEPELQLDPRLDGADIRAPLELDDPAPSLQSLPRTRRFAPRDQTGEIPEGRLRWAIYRRDMIYRRALAFADLASAAIAVLIGVPILGNDALNRFAPRPPLVLVVGAPGLYDRDGHLIRKTTLDESRELFWSRLSTRSSSSWADKIVDGGFGRDQAVVWALLLPAWSRSGSPEAARTLRRGCAVLRRRDWRRIMRRFHGAPGLNARVIGRAPLKSVFGERRLEPNGNGHSGGRETATWSVCSPRTGSARDHLAPGSPMTS